MYIEKLILFMVSFLIIFYVIKKIKNHNKKDTKFFHKHDQLSKHPSLRPVSVEDNPSLQAKLLSLCSYCKIHFFKQEDSPLCSKCSNQLNTQFYCIHCNHPIEQHSSHNCQVKHQTFQLKDSKEYLTSALLPYAIKSNYLRKILDKNNLVSSIDKDLYKVKLDDDSIDQGDTADDDSNSDE